MLENVLLQHLDVWRERLAPRPNVFFWRTASGAEVDFVVQQRRRLLPVDVKLGGVVRAMDALHLAQFLDEYPEARFGLVLHTGTEVYPVTSRVIAAPLDALIA